MGARETPTRLSQFGPVLDGSIIQETLPFGGHFLSAAFDAVICFSMAELDEAEEVAFVAKSEGSVGDQSGEPLRLPDPLSTFHNPP